MKPEIYFVTQEDGTDSGFLVDRDSVIVRKENGKMRTHYTAALNIYDLKAGEIRVGKSEDGKITELHFPKPEVFCLRKDMKKYTSLWARMIHPKAAEVLLKLAASANNVQASMDGSSEWQFGDIVERSKNPEVIAANSSKMLAAWLWSAWDLKKSNGTQRHAEMKALGYQGTPEALRHMLSDLGLVATKKS
jgi:hypothetical protein